MKRRMIAFFLTVAMLISCSFAIAIHTFAEEQEAPVVDFVGHQRTNAVTDRYGIRLVGVVNDLSLKAVGFDIAVILEDGSVGTYSREVTAVYRSIKGEVNGEVQDITAADIDEAYAGAYLFTVKINDIPADRGFIGFLGSAYFVDADGNKISGKTKRVIYQGTEQWKEAYVVGPAVKTIYQGYDVGTAGSDQYQFLAKTDGSEMQYMWDGVDDTTYGALFTWGTAADGSYNTGASCTAKFENPTRIGRIRLASVWHQDYNKGTQVQASVDGKTWITLYTISEDRDSAFLVHGWGQKYLTIEVSDTAKYNYIRVYDSGTNGVSFSEITVYAAQTGTLEKVNTAYSEHGVTGTDYGFYGTDRAESEVGYMWDGVVDSKHVHCFTWGASQGSAYNTAKLESAAEIHKIVLWVTAKHNRNIGTMIQASVDGKEWDTLYTISNADGDFVKDDGTLKSLEFTVESEKAYRYIRVKDSTKDGYDFAEVEIFTVVREFNDTFAELLEMQLPVAAAQ